MTQSDPLSPPTGHLLSFLELTQDLDSIYNSYANPLQNVLQDTLDLANNEPAYLARRLRHSTYEPDSHQSGPALPLPVVDLENGSYADTDNEISAVESIDGSYDPQMTSRDLLLGLLGDRHLSLSDVYRSSDSISVDHLAGPLAQNTASQSSNGVHALKSPARPTHLAPQPPNKQTTLKTPSNSETPSKVNLSSNSLDLAKIVDGTSTDHYHATRTVQDPEDPYKYTTLTRGVDDFKFGKSLGEGLYLTVVLATDKHTSTKYAVKILDKRHIIKEKKVKYVNIEKHALNRLANRCGIISLYFTFQDKHRLFFVLEYASNGELLALIKKYGSLNEDCVRHFSVQLLDAMNFMHSNGVIHRDIKPENVLLDSQMRIQITDFGTARLLEKKKKRKDLPLELDLEEEEYPLDVRAKLFVGTAEYVLPELLDSKYCGKPGDLWAFGCIVYQMIAGKPPFKGANEYQTFQRITKLQYAFSAGFPMIVRDLIKQILVLQPLRRFTILQIQRHIFYEGVDWSDFDAIWMSGHPELGPYKMSAKLMMKPVLMQLLLKVPTKKAKERTPAPSAPGSSSSVQTVKSVHSQPVPSSQKTRRPQSKVNPASAAAFALGPLEENTKIALKREPKEKKNERDIKERESKEAELKESKELKEAKEKKRSPADYIPGTNILRPQVNAHAIRTLTAGSKRLKESASSSLSLVKSKSRVLDVTPISPLEQAWLGYLHHNDERILKIGPVIAQKVTVENFERKYKGLVVDLPLGGLKNGRSNGRFVNLTNGATLRENDGDVESFDELVSLIIPEEFKDTANDSRKDSSEADLKRLGSTKKSDDTGSTTTSKRSLFKKLLPVGSRNSDHASTSTLSSPLEKQQTCSMLITTHGRVLLFLRDDAKQNYKLVLELQLDHPFVQLKEVVSAGVASKFLLRMVPLTGVFAVKLVETVVVFEVEKFDVNLWTEALLKAKNNEHERKLEVSKVELETSNVTNTSTGTANSTVSQSLPNVQKERIISGTYGASEASATSGPTGNSRNVGTSGKSASNLRNTAPVMNQSPQFSSSPKLPNILKVVTSPKKISSPKMNSSSGIGSPKQDPEELPDLGVHYVSSSPKQHSSDKVKVRVSKSIKRKPPPPTNLNMSTGLSNKDESATLLAAQKAVSSVTGQFSPTQRSSFSKDNEAKTWSTPYKSRITHPQQQQQQQQGNPKITSLNSKLLSRSRNK